METAALSHLYGADDGAEQAEHAQKLHSAQVLHCVLLSHIRHGVQHRAEQDQGVAQQDVWGCGENKHLMITAWFHSVQLFFMIGLVYVQQTFSRGTQNKSKSSIYELPVSLSSALERRQIPLLSLLFL